MCHASGIRVMSRDHNSVRANDGGRQAARRAGIRYVSGRDRLHVQRCESSCTGGMDLTIPVMIFADIEDNISSQGSDGIQADAFAQPGKMGFGRNRGGYGGTGRRLLEGPVDRGNVCRGAPWPGGIQGPSPRFFLTGNGGARGDNPYVNFYWIFYSQGKCC